MKSLLKPEFWCLLCWNVTFAHEVQRLDMWPFNVETVKPAPGLQSPIDIPISKIKMVDLPPLKYNDFVKNASDIVQCGNDGKSLVCLLITGEQPSIEGGPLPGRYIFQNTHWHWGRTNDYGSEHTIDGKRYPVEMHAVFWREEYGNVMNAMEHVDGLAILAFLGDVSKSDEDNPDLKVLFDDAKDMTPFGSNQERPWPVYMTFLNNLLLQHDGKTTENGNQNWLTYPGALTAPPYFWESATWMIYGQIIPISNRQIARLRELRTPENKKNEEHTRDVFPLNDRPIYTRCESCNNVDLFPAIPKLQPLNIQPQTSFNLNLPQNPILHQVLLQKPLSLINGTEALRKFQTPIDEIPNNVKV